MTRSLNILGIFVVIAALGACSDDGSDAKVTDSSDNRARTAKEASPKPLELLWDGRILTVSGSGPAGLAATIRAAFDPPSEPECGVERIIVAIHPPFKETSFIFPPVPVSDIAALVCSTSKLDMAYDWNARTVEGVGTTRDMNIDKTISSRFSDGQVGPWTYQLSLDTDLSVIPEGVGRVEFVADPKEPEARYDILPVVDGESSPNQVWGRVKRWLKPGIYKVSNGDHFAVRNGFETRVLLGNPAVVWVSGLRFPLDDQVPMPPDSDLADVKGTLESCESVKGAKKPTCGVRHTDTGDPVPVSDLGRVREFVHQVVVHTDRLADAEETGRVLNKEGISTHLVIDFDGTLYQFVDLAYASFHIKKGRDHSIGIDFNNLMENLLRNKEAPPYPLDHKRIEDMK